MKLVKVNWFQTPPIDFEHKQYLLYAYLQCVDKSFLGRKVSPHLLHLQKLLNEMDIFLCKYTQMKEAFNKKRYHYFDNPKLEGEENVEVDQIVEIVDFSIPQVKSRIEQGYVIYKKYPEQILH